MTNDYDELSRRWLWSKSRHTEEEWVELWRACEDAPRGRPVSGTVYRAAMEGHAEGMSWSPQRRVAERFLVGSRQLWQTRLRARAVLVVIEIDNFWDEETTELVLDPELLGRVTEVPDQAERPMSAAERLSRTESFLAAATARKRERDAATERLRARLKANGRARARRRRR